MQTKGHEITEPEAVTTSQRQMDSAFEFLNGLALPVTEPEFEQGLEKIGRMLALAEFALMRTPVGWRHASDTAAPKENGFILLLAQKQASGHITIDLGFVGQESEVSRIIHSFMDKQTT